MNKLAQYVGQISSPIRLKTIFHSPLTESMVSTPDDYSSMARLIGDKCIPVHLNAPENYLLLENIIKLAKEAIPDIDYFLCELQMPGICRIRQRLLEDDVFLVVDLTYDRDVLCGEGHNVLCIENDLVRDPIEAGSNQLRLTLYSANTISDSWPTLIQKVNNLGFDEVSL